MKIDKTKSTKTSTVLLVSASEEELKDIKRQVLNKLRPTVKAAGFRPGRAPDNIVERELGSNILAQEFLESAISIIYHRALGLEELRPIGQPEVSLKKFAPFTELQVEYSIELFPDLKLADYKNLKSELKSVKVTDKDVLKVVDQLRSRMAERKTVNRAVKTNDEVTIDFKGLNEKGDVIAGASGTDFPLRIGSETFVPGFEENLVGLKPDETKSFTVTFPKDYRTKSLQGAKVKFEINVKKIEELHLPKVDDELAKKIGPFKDLDELKKDIKEQLESEKYEQNKSEQREDLVKQLIEKSDIPVPEKMLEKIKDELWQEFRQNLMMRGIEDKVYFEQNGTTREEYEKKEVLPAAKKRIKASFALSEVANIENLSMSKEELEESIKLLRERYSDEEAQKQLDKPEVREDIAMQLLTQKAIDKLVEFNDKKS